MEACGSEIHPRFYGESGGASWTDEAAIRRLIRDEGDSAEAEDVIWHASLFHPEAIFQDKLSHSQAHTCHEIVERDIKIFSSLRFQEIEDRVLVLSVDGSQAFALTEHRERILRTRKGESRPVPGEVTREIHAYIEWKFLRDDSGIWRIFSFIPGVEPVEGDAGFSKDLVSQSMTHWNGRWRQEFMGIGGLVSGVLDFQVFDDLSVRGTGEFMLSGKKIETEILARLEDEGLVMVGTWSNSLDQEGNLILSLKGAGREFSGSFSNSLAIKADENASNFWHGQKEGDP